MQSLSAPPREEHARQLSAYVETEEVKRLREKIHSLYTRGLRAEIISSLYRLPKLLVHAWGRWNQMPRTDLTRSTAKLARDMLLQGASESVITSILKISSSIKLARMLGHFTIPKRYTAAQKAFTVSYNSRLNDFERTCVLLGVPEQRLHAWINGQDLESDAEYLDHGYGPRRDATRLHSLEEYYLNGTHFAVAAAGAESDRVREWIAEFERNSLNAPRRRQRTEADV
jgi:hypothetical protein